ncbi:MAG: ABC transporter ATP-binding protein [Chitinophagales bacterium]
MPAKNIISVNDLSIGFSQKPVLQGINFEIDENDIVAILGLNGAGKSTLLRTISGLQHKISGEIFIQNKNADQYGNNELAQIIGIVLPGRGEVVLSLTVNEILSMARSPYTGFMHKISEADEQMISQTLQRLKIDHIKTRKIYQLSDGEAQKVFIAKALVQETPLILMDEPTSFLDIKSKLEIFALIKELGNRNKTIVFASHELDLAVQVANKCFLIDKFRNFVFGKTYDLINNNLFPRFFDDEHLRFDKDKGRFEIELR